RPPRPDYRVNIAPTAPAVGKGSGLAINVNAERIDDYDGPIEVRLDNLPPGFSAPATSIPEGENSTSFTLFAEANAAAPTGKPALKLVARAAIDGREVVRESVGGTPTLVDPGDLLATTEQSEVTVKPGGQV